MQAQSWHIIGAVLSLRFQARQSLTNTIAFRHVAHYSYPQGCMPGNAAADAKCCSGQGHTDVTCGLPKAYKCDTVDPNTCFKVRTRGIGALRQIHAADTYPRSIALGWMHAWKRSRKCHMLPWLLWILRFQMSGTEVLQLRASNDNSRCFGHMSKRCILLVWMVKMSKSYTASQKLHPSSSLMKDAGSYARLLLLF